MILVFKFLKKYASLLFIFFSILTSAEAHTLTAYLSSSNAIEGGLYTNINNDTRPLLASSHDGGDTWFYPTTILSELPHSESSRAQFNGAACSGVNCTAVGFFKYLSPGNITMPLCATSFDSGNTWNYPESVITNLPSDFESGNFESLPRCSNGNCIAAGKYTTHTQTQMPLLAVSHNHGLTFEYPPSIFSNLPADFSDYSRFNTTTSIGHTFIAAGQYRNQFNNTVPLLSVSQDGGYTFTYPQTILSQLPADFKRGGIFNGLSCSENACVAGGTYVTLSLTTQVYPLIAVSHDLGSNWFYPTIATQLPPNFLKMNFLKSVSCSGQNCIAVGQFQIQSEEPESTRLPFLMSSQDGGEHWMTPPSILNGLPADFQNNGKFEGAHCNRNICIAVGEYRSTLPGKSFLPLLAVSVDGGVTFIYPTTIISNLPVNMARGSFYTTSCNKNDCIAAGQQRAQNTGKDYPLIATSHDGGLSWIYPGSVLSNLPEDYKSEGIFTGGYSSFV